MATYFNLIYLHKILVTTLIDYLNIEPDKGAFIYVPSKSSYYKLRIMSHHFEFFLPVILIKLSWIFATRDKCSWKRQTQLEH